jgi:hypothetical protein
MGLLSQRERGAFTLPGYGALRSTSCRRTALRSTGWMAVTAHPFPLPNTQSDACKTRLMKEAVALLRNRSVGGTAPHERLPPSEMHSAGEVETRSCRGDGLAWEREGREGILTPAVTCVLAWAASSSGAAALTAMWSGAVKESGPSVLHACRMSSKKTQQYPAFISFSSNPPQRLKFIVSFRYGFLPPHLGCAGGTPHRRQGCVDTYVKITVGVRA